MKCFLCYYPETVAGTTSVLLERGHLTLTVTHVPARICPNCGEAYTEEAVTVNLLRQAEEMVKAGAKVDSCEYELL
ncbi:MAG: type II toxin-antitoxin system MqsA family antitoxin [Anaerolineales bacterium]|nr:type II toxin-antitoxin system MqsA family antitoxin [Anaerolineales bacterium]